MRRSINGAAEAATRPRPLKRSYAGLPAGAEPRVYPRMMRRSSLVLVAAALLLVPLRPARAQVIGEAVELERAGRQARAAVVYMAVLRGEPTNLAALLGLERVLPPLGRLPELLPLVRRALARDSANRAFRALEVRTLATLNEPDSAEAAARRWIALAPGDEGPYREWALALADARRFEEARAVLVAGQRALGGGGSRAGALAVELADLAARRGDWEEAAREWGRAATAAPDQLPNAAAQLADVPAEQRDRVTPAPVADPSPLARRPGARLPPGWGATARLATAGDRVPAEDRAALRRALVRARVRRGELARADSTLAGDSSVDAAALRGWVALYRGDLKAGADLFRAAGPYAGERSDATERTAMLALVQQVRRDRFPELGDALLTLARGDSTRAVQALRLTAAQLSTEGQGGGAAEVLLLAGRIAARPGAGPDAERTAAALFTEVVRTGGAGGTGGTGAAAP